MKELKTWKMKPILREYDKNSKCKNISNLIRWISHRMPKLTEFLFKWSVSWKLFVSRSPTENKYPYSVIHYRVSFPSFHKETKDKEKKVRMRKEKSKNV